MRFFAALSILTCSVGVATAADGGSPTNSAAPASSTSTSGSSCAAQPVLDACLGLEQPQLAACEANDWDCLCNQANNVLTCYNNCPSDPNAFSAQQVKVSYCNAASAYGTSSSAVLPTSTAASTSQPSNVSPSGASQSSDASETSSSSSPLESNGSSSSSAASPSNSSTKSEKGAAAGLAINAASLLMAIILGIGAAM